MYIVIVTLSRKRSRGTLHRRTTNMSIKPDSMVKIDPVSSKSVQVLEIAIYRLLDRMITSPRGKGAKYLDAYFSLSLSLCRIIWKSHGRILPNLLCLLPVIMAQSSSVGVAIRYVLLILWIPWGVHNDLFKRSSSASGTSWTPDNYIGMRHLGQSLLSTIDSLLLSRRIGKADIITLHWQASFLRSFSESSSPAYVIIDTCRYFVMSW